MINFPILYTGKGTSKPLADMGDSFEKFSQKFMDAQRMKLEKKLSDEQFLLENQIDPIQLMADEAMTKQAANIEWYNDKYAKRMSENDGMLSSQDKLEMAADKRRVIGDQQKLAMAQERALKDYAIIQSDTKGLYDKYDFYDKWYDFMRTGEYDPTPLKTSPLDADIYFEKASWSATPTETTPDPKTGHYVKSSATLEEAKQGFWAHIAQDIGRQGRLLKDITGKFNTLPPDEKRNILDRNKDGMISQEEEQAMSLTGGLNGLRANPIMQWAEQKYAPMLIKQTPMAGTKPTSTGGATEISKPAKYGSQTYKRPMAATDVTYGEQITDPDTGQVISTPQTVQGEWTFTDPIKVTGVIPANSAKVLTGLSDRLSSNMSTNFEVRGYSQITDEFIIGIPKENVEQGVYTSYSTVVRVPSDALKPDLLELEVNDNGKIKTIKQLKEERKEKGMVETAGVDLGF